MFSAMRILLTGPSCCAHCGLMQVAGQAVPITKEATGGIVRPGGKEVSRIADKYSDDATKDRVQVRASAAPLGTGLLAVSLAWPR